MRKVMYVMFSHPSGMLNEHGDLTKSVLNHQYPLERIFNNWLRV
jgi:hypothetical protein